LDWRRTDASIVSDVLLNDRPGALAHLSAVLANAGANVTEIVHNRTFAGPDLSRVHVLCTVETRDRAHITEIQKMSGRKWRGTSFQWQHRAAIKLN
jgi:ACT domain-containing protein